ncbi:MAG: PilZ domain-containing protein [Syntrophobacteraceae bacterium]
MMQKRKFSRVEFKAEAIVESKGHQIRGMVENLSLKGMLLITTERPSVNEEVDINIFLTATTSELTVRLRGVVVRHQENGIAVNFDSMDLDSFIHLRNIVSYNLGDDDAVMDEFFKYMRRDDF